MNPGGRHSSGAVQVRGPLRGLSGPCLRSGSAGDWDRRTRVSAPRASPRPMHADEGNQAVRTGLLLETGHYRYDP